MKINLRATFLATAILLVLALIIGLSHGLAAGAVAYAAGSLALTSLNKRQGACFTPTLIVPILTGTVFEAFKPKAVPMLDWVSTDFGKSGSGFAQPVKFGQEVISQLATVPTVTRTTPGGITTTAQSSTTLVSDLSVLIDRMAAIKIRLPSDDIQKLLAMPAFMAELKESSQGLARFMVTDAIAEAASARNFTYGTTAATPDLTTLDTQRQALNNQLALEPRYGVGTTAFLGRIANDPRVMLQYGFNQRIGDSPFASFQNLYGLKELREIQNFPTGNKTIGTFTAATSDVCTITSLVSDADQLLNVDPVINFHNGMRVQVSTTNTLPTGLSASTNYYVRDYTPDATNGVVGGSGVGGTFKLSATLGGAAVDISGAGSGTHTITQAENLEAFFFEKRAIHVASRPMIDPTTAAKALGIPQTMLVQQELDTNTGVSITTFMWQDTQGTNPTLDVFMAFVIQYGIRAGRGIGQRPTVSMDPTAAAAGSGMDRCGFRVITA